MNNRTLARLTLVIIAAIIFLITINFGNIFFKIPIKYPFLTRVLDKECSSFERDFLSDLKIFSKPIAKCPTGEKKFSKLEEKILEGDHSLSKIRVFLNYNTVEGIAISRNQLMYSLNFKQQKQFIDILNLETAVQGGANPIEEIPSTDHSAINFDAITIYLFNSKPIVLTPLNFIENQFVFETNGWIPYRYLMEKSGGKLKTLLMESYD